MARIHKSTMTTTKATLKVVTPDDNIISTELELSGKYANKEAVEKACKKSLPDGYTLVRVTEYKEDLALYLYSDEIILKYGRKATKEEADKYFAQNEKTED